MFIDSAASCFRKDNLIISKLVLVFNDTAGHWLAVTVAEKFCCLDFLKQIFWTFNISM